MCKRPWLRRIGPTADRGYCVLARPTNVAETIEDARATNGASILTATAWMRNPDGTLRGKWFDSPNGKVYTAWVN